ncbi:bud site selection protein 31 [Nematocida sp. LUAm3]|nr:bud site selection protein 31 [Nematocida sp. LUAm3]KAI5173739.1 bud site selection protein 31 [Nematocida sp. LUAm2]KAI5176962.1 bud site selection protein 31 [Nematocida sp. LUAm1]
MSEKRLNSYTARYSLEKREVRQAKILKGIRERSERVFLSWKKGLLSNKELGRKIANEEADLNLIQAWKKGLSICCVLCIRKGKRCICRKIQGIECVNCGCKGECIKEDI